MSGGNRLKSALAAGEVQVGIWLAGASSVMAEIAGRAGFDWCLIDAEHGPNTLTTIRDQLVALAATGTPALVRVPVAKDWILKQVLDLGAQSILVPMVHDGASAAAVVAACRYPPAGRRGIGAGLVRASGYGADAGYAARADAETCVIVQIESRAAVQDIDAIAGTDGVDAVFVGPADLAADMGHPGDPAHPEVIAAIGRVAERALAAGKAAGAFAFDPEQIAALRTAGLTMFGVGADTTILSAALRDTAFSTKTRLH